MEDLLLALERDRLREKDKHAHAFKSTGISANASSTKQQKEVEVACNAFAMALHELAFQFAEKSDFDECKDSNVVSASASASSTAAKEKEEESIASWLYNLSSTIPSPLDAFALSSGILSACQRGDDTSVQSALFEILGESERAMEVLFEIMPKANEISNQVTERHLKSIHEGGIGSASASAFADIPDIDPEIEHLNFLRLQAMETAEYASLLKTEVEGYAIGGGPAATTHTVKRSSDKAASKRLKQAVKAAAAALAAAKEAGAIVDDDDYNARGYDAGTLAAEAADQFNSGLHQMNDVEFDHFKSSLLPEGTKEYNEPKGLPKGSEREYFDGYEMVTVPAAVMDPAQLHKRIVLTDVMTKNELKAFAGTASLNPMQSAVFQTAFHSSENLLIW